MKLYALTGLRFVAASMIVVHHSYRLHIPLPEIALDHGVSFFFVLSGFILSYVYPTLESRSAIASFLVARIARIWPAHVMALLLVIVMLHTPLDRTIIANVLLVHGWIPSWPWYFSYNSVSWSVSTELFFYMSFPFLIRRWDQSWWWKWLGSALLIFGLIWLGKAAHLPTMSHKDMPTVHGLLYTNPLARLFEFVTGMVTYSAFRRLRPLAGSAGVPLFTALELLVMGVAVYSVVSSRLLILLAPIFGRAGSEWLGHSSDAFVFPFVVLVFAFGKGIASSFFASAPLVFLGEISYSIYLLHFLVFESYARRWGVTGTSPDYFGFAVCVAVTMVGAATMWAFVEVPCRNAAKRRLARDVGLFDSTRNNRWGLNLPRSPR